MKFIKAVLFFVVIMVALVVGVLFSTRNSQAVSLDLIFFQLPPMSMAIWLLLSLAMGMLLCAFIYSVVTFKLKRHNTQLQRQLSKANQSQSLNKVI
ncbi:LapA family protein [Candidatus Njordibacter sp. Uisw_056]|uniref:LapA family protein n=1 Tax=Candidatus Njordibacter sp. Uisw_056 TaxID=3230973 RepID=UPI003D480BF2